MTILLTGATGKTGTELAKTLQAAGLSILIASRSGKAPVPFKAITFDWLDPTTFENPFNADPSIDRVYIVAPSWLVDLMPIVRPFIDLARARGVKRFVLLSSSSFEPGELPLGPIHQYLINSGVDYAVLRPTWFQQNFGTLHAASIRNTNQILSATGDGRIPFVSTQDIAKAALEALTAEPSLNKDLLLIGPELFTHDEVAKMLSTHLGREITHKKLSVEELTTLYATEFGLPDDYAEIYAIKENGVGQGVEEKLFTEPSSDRTSVGTHRLEDYILANLELWSEE
ncbi:NAD(P)-binding protein [Pholiota conissans]|uniref:NAD(P)-binding protein n=1 Tax=Pholiota conissans TaxID=109636 RepID=A0A9P6CZ29_9AGAR|nr:NAD(P)-binding protein [Pholiota conissans]